MYLGRSVLSDVVHTEGREQTERETSNNNNKNASDSAPFGSYSSTGLSGVVQCWTVRWLRVCQRNVRFLNTFLDVLCYYKHACVWH